MAPVLVGMLPFGLVYGISAAGIGLPGWLNLGMSLSVFAGSAQLAAVQLLADGAPAMVIILTTFVINLRFAMYSAAMAVHWPPLSLRWRVLSAYLVTDQSFAISSVHYAEQPEAPHRLAYYLGSGLAMWATWQTAVLLGMLLGKGLPTNWPLDFAIPLVFAVMMFKSVTDRPTLVAALVAGAVAVGAHGLPLNLSLILGALAGIGAGLVVEVRDHA